MIDPRNIASVGTAVQADAGGVGFVPDQNIKPVWGVITGLSPFEDAPNNYTWEEVRFDDNWEWAPVQGSLSAGTYGSEWSGEHLLSPAREANGGSVEVGAIVYLIPSRPIGDVGGFSHRVWFFSNPTTNLRPFVLVEDLIPTGGGELDSSVKAEWLDLPFSIAPRSIEELSVTLYPAHKGEVDNPDAFFALGIGRGPSTYFRGTYGWATFNPVGRTEMKNGKAESVGEWQVVTLYAELDAQVLIETTIEAGDTGVGTLFWQDKDSATETMIDSGFELAIFNTLFTPLIVGTVVTVRFSRNHYNWVPDDIPPQHGHTIHDSGAGQTSTSAFVVVACDLNLNNFGVALEHNGNTIKNISDGDVIGIAAWQFVAHRDFSGAMPADADAICHVALFNNGALVTPTESMLSSSRRLVANEGNRAVNTCSGSCIIKIATGEAIDLRFKHSLNADANDKYITEPGLNHLTFTTIPGVILNP